MGALQQVVFNKNDLELEQQLEMLAAQLEHTQRQLSAMTKIAERQQARSNRLAIELELSQQEIKRLKRSTLPDESNPFGDWLKRKK